MVMKQIYENIPTMFFALVIFCFLCVQPNLYSVVALDLHALTFEKVFSVKYFINLVPMSIKLLYVSGS